MNPTWVREPAYPEQPTAGPSSRSAGRGQGPSRPPHVHSRGNLGRQSPINHGYGAAQHNNSNAYWEQRRDSQYRGGHRRSHYLNYPTHTTHTGLATYSQAIKSSYPSVHPSSALASFDDDDSNGQRAPRRIAASTRPVIATRAARKTSEIRIVAGPRYHIVDGELVEIAEDANSSTSSGEQ
jgi:hypothetical protein